MFNAGENKFRYERMFQRCLEVLILFDELLIFRSRLQKPGNTTTPKIRELKSQQDRSSIINQKLKW